MKKLLKSKVKVNPYQKLESRIHPVEESVGAKATLIYGKASTGKTASAGTWPKPMLLLDIHGEKGTNTLANTKGVDVIRVDTWEEFEELFWYLEENRKGYKSVVLDQITELQDLAMDKVRADDDLKKTDLITRRAWGRISGMMKTWLYNFRGLRSTGLEVVFLAHERANDGSDDSGEDQLDPSIGARVMPSVASFLNGAVDIIGNTFIRERMVGPKGQKERKVEYRMRLGPHAFYSSKIRVPMGSGIEIPESISNPTYEKLMKLSRGETLDPPTAKKVVKKVIKR